LLCIVCIWDGQFDIDFNHSHGRQQAFVAKLIHHLYCHGGYFGFPFNHMNCTTEQALADCNQILNEQGKGNEAVSKEASEYAKSMKAALTSSMADDLCTPVAIAALSEPLKLMNDLMHTKKVCFCHSICTWIC
jgi:hypothetical protein